jgi:hypothetical protein
MPFKDDIDKNNQKFRFWDKERSNDLSFFNSVAQEINRIGCPPVLYKSLRVSDTQVDEIFGDSPNPVYDAPVEIFCSYTPQDIIMELMQFGLSGLDEDLNIACNAKHFKEKTNGKEPHEGDKFIDSRDKVYKISKVVRDTENVFFGEPYTYIMTAKLTEEEF